MPQYWMEDYDSNNGIEEPFILDAAKRCEEIIKQKKFVRIGYVILELMNEDASKYDLFRVLNILEQTGKYQSRFIKHRNGRDDFLVSKVPKKTFLERYWYLFEAGKVAIGIIIGYVFSRLFHI